MEKIQFKYGPENFVLTLDGAPIGSVHSKEHAELIEQATTAIPVLEYKVETLTKENDELNALQSRSTSTLTKLEQEIVRLKKIIDANELQG